MVSAIVLMSVEGSRITEVAEKLVLIPGVSEVYSVAGRYDLVTIIRVVDNESMARIVTEEILKIVGIQKTETLLSFRVYSQHDLERIFSIGLE